MQAFETSWLGPFYDVPAMMSEDATLESKDDCDPKDDCDLKDDCDALSAKATITKAHVVGPMPVDEFIGQFLPDSTSDEQHVAATIDRDDDAGSLVCFALQRCHHWFDP